MGFASQASFSTSSRQPGAVWTRGVSRQGVGETIAFRTGPKNHDPTRQCTGCGRMRHDVNHILRLLDIPNGGLKDLVANLERGDLKLFLQDVDVA